MRSQTLFHVIEDILKEAKEPLTCNDLLEKPAVRTFTSSANRVSDYLGAMRRKGELERYPAEKTRESGARWSYSIKKKTAGKDRLKSVSSSRQPVLTRPGLQISEDGGMVTIELPHIIITIKGRDGNADVTPGSAR